MRWILLLYVSVASALSIYDNARFEPENLLYNFMNKTAVLSLIDCICVCANNTMCLSGTYQANDQLCQLFLVPMEEGIVRVATTLQRMTFFTFRNNTLPITATLTSGNDSVMGIWGTTAGSSSSSSSFGGSSGQYQQLQGPQNAFDRSVATKYVNYGVCSSSWVFPSRECGQNTGLYIALGRGASILLGFRYRTADYNADLDPISVTIEGSNNTFATLPNGSSWTLIYNGSCGLEPDPGRYSAGKMQWLPSNSLWYSSYRLLVLEKRGIGYVVQYAEIELFGY